MELGETKALKPEGVKRVGVCRRYPHSPSQLLRGCGSVVSLCGGVRGGASAENDFVACSA